MNWIVASLIMFTSSVGVHLFIRKSTLQKTPIQLINCSLFLIPLLFTSYIAYVQKQYFSFTLYQFVIITIMAFICSYIGNILYLKSVEYAPNPGYSLTITKSYVVFPTIASVFLFQGTISFRSLLAIILIVVSSTCFFNIKSIHNPTKISHSWLPYSIGAFFCWGLFALASKYLLLSGLSIISILLPQYIMTTILILLEIHRGKVQWKHMSTNQVIVLVCLGICAFIFNYFMQVAIDMAPNVGFVNAINASTIGIISVFSTLLFKDELTKQKAFGIVGVTVGLILLVL